MTKGMDFNDAHRKGLDPERDVVRRPVGTTDLDTSDRSDECGICAPFGDPVASVTSVSNPPPFPLHVLPDAFQEFVRVFARCTDTTPDAVVPAILGVMAASLGPNFQVGARSLIRPPRLWFALVMGSGSGKTPAVNAILKPIHQRDKELGEEYREALGRYERAQRASSRRNTGDDSVLSRPNRKRAAVTDLTPDGIVKALASSPQGVLAHSDELAQLLSSLDAHSAPGRGRAIFLSLWSGSRIAEARKTAEECEADEPYLVIFGGVQPSKIVDLDLADGDGLTTRFLWSFPAFREGGLGWPIGPQVIEAWDRVVAAARTLGGRAPALLSESGTERLDTLVRTWRSEAHRWEVAQAGLMASLYGKAADHCVRLLALLHGMDMLAEALDRGDLSSIRFQYTVPDTTLDRALTLLEYYIAHGRAVIELAVKSSSSRSAPALPPADSGILRCLKQMVRAGEDLTHSAGEWAELIESCDYRVVRSDVEMGRALSRLQHAETSPLVIEPCPRGKTRSWRVRCPEQVTEVTEVSGSAILAQDRAPRPSDASVASVESAASRANGSQPSRTGKDALAPHEERGR